MVVGKLCNTFKTYFEKDLFDSNVWNSIPEEDFIESLNMYNYLFNKRYIFLPDSNEIIYSLKDSGEDIYKVVVRKFS